MDVSLLNSLGRVWWLVLLRGIAAIAFGGLLVGLAFRLKKHATPSTPAAK